MFGVRFGVDGLRWSLGGLFCFVVALVWFLFWVVVDVGFVVVDVGFVGGLIGFSLRVCYAWWVCLVDGLGVVVVLGGVVWDVCVGVVYIWFVSF